MSDVCVVHLVWGPLGIEPFADFVASYRHSRAGVNHQLLVVFNGVREARELDDYDILLSGLAYTSLVMPRPTLDIPAYFAAAKNVDCKYLCFLNSHSVILADDWLAKMYKHVAREGVGLVGATGSYESHYSAVIHTPHSRSGILLKDMWEMFYKRLVVNTKYKMYFPPFPNYHIRTNAFMLPRSVMLRLKGAGARSKMDAYRFESGRRSMTRQVLSMNLETLVVGRDGRAYEKDRWSTSRTFRSDDQSNLLVADNRTRQYTTADPGFRRLLVEYAWGAEGVGRSC